MAATGHSKYIVTELKAPFTAEYAARYSKFAKRILWMDDNVVEGAFQMNCSWYLHPTENTPEAHTHDCDEIIGFFGSDPDDPYALHGEVEFWIEDEKFLLDRTCMIFIPAGMRHCPLVLRRVDMPIFHFSTVTGKIYETKEA